MKTRECDFLVVGGGLGGLAAAARARWLGLDVVILEKTGYLGGVTAYSGGVVWVGNNHIAERENCGDTREQAARYLDFISGADDPNYDRSLRAAFLDGSRAAIEFYTEEAGVPFSSIRRPDQYYPDAPGSMPSGRTLEVAIHGRVLGEWRQRLRPSVHFKIGLTQREIAENGGRLWAFRNLADVYRQRLAEDYLTLGQGLVGGFLKAAVIDGGAEVHLNADVRRLTQEDGRVTGAVAVIDGAEVVFAARRGVLLATGSYGYHPDAARMEGLPALKEQSPPIIHGDALRLADPTPAAVTRAGITFTSLGFASRKLTHPGSDEPVYHPLYESLGFPHCIVVNQRGERFGDESSYGTFINEMQAFDPHTKRFPNYPAFLVVDDRFRQNYTLAQLDEWPEDVLTRADTLVELARALGIDAEGLEATVKRYNQFVEAGEDADFHRGSRSFVQTMKYGGERVGDRNPTLGTIAQPPFWGVRLELIGCGIYSMGLPINHSAQVLTRDGNPVEGLYAAGNAAAYTEFLHGYEGGLANARGITYGFLAANHAAGQGWSTAPAV